MRADVVAICYNVRMNLIATDKSYFAGRRKPGRIGGRRWMPCLVLAMTCVSAAMCPAADALHPCAPEAVRLGGWAGAKMDRFFAERIFSPFAREVVFGEARAAFAMKMDDASGVGGYWQGEFWGKLMMGAARVAMYTGDAELRRFVVEECRRLMRHQDADGYLGSYRDKTLVCIRDEKACRKAHGWLAQWNLWNRKYTIWGMYMAWRATGEADLLASVERQMNQWIDMMHELKLPLHAAGTPRFVGLPAMSVLKPLLMLYETTGRAKYLDYAKEMLPDWDRDDNAAPNFFRNAFSGKHVSEWYPNPDEWAKAYEMMSCLDGLLEYHRVTGDRRALETVKVIRDDLVATELNALGGVGYRDKFAGAGARPNAATEVCDSIHWMRLNYDLYLITGEPKYMDSVEVCYYNAFLAGVFRNGKWGAFAARSHVHHQTAQTACGFKHNHCCVNNVPRGFMDFAEGTVSTNASGVVHVAQYQDATVTLDGLKLTIAGNYPVGDEVTVTAVASRPQTVRFRVPGWSRADADRGAWREVSVPAGTSVHRLAFDLTPRMVASAAKPVEGEVAKNPAVISWAKGDFLNLDVLARALDRPAARLTRGPLVLAKATSVGGSAAELFARQTDNGMGASVSLVRREARTTWGAWTAEIRTPSGLVQVPVCDYQSAGDEDTPPCREAFSIWF